MKEETKEKIEDWCLDYIPGWMWRIKGKYETFCMYSRHYIQKVFRKNHVSDYDCWCVHTPMAKSILRYLKAFKNSTRHGYPMDFTEYSDHPDWAHGEITEEEYTEKYPGGGPEKWERYLDEMIYAFEYSLTDGCTTWDDEDEWFYKKYDLKKEDCIVETCDLWEDSFEYLSFTNEKREELRERYEKGMGYFAKYFLNLWD